MSEIVWRKKRKGVFVVRAERNSVILSTSSYFKIISLSCETNGFLYNVSEQYNHQLFFGIEIKSQYLKPKGHVDEHCYAVSTNLSWHKVRIGEICVHWSVNQTFPTIKPLLASLTQNTVTFFTLITSHNDVNLLCEHHRAIWLIHYDLCLMLVCLQISTLLWLPWEIKL